MIENSETDLAAQVEWLEYIIHEVEFCGSDLWQSPYADMFKLPVVLKSYLDILQQHLPDGVKTTPSQSTRIVLLDLIRLKGYAKQRENLPERWSATLITCLISLNDMEHERVTDFGQNLMFRCNKLLKLAVTHGLP